MKEEMSKKDWLERRYIVDLARKEDIANELGCSVHNVSRLVKKYGLKRGKATQIGKKPWNYGLTKETSSAMRAVSEKQSGENNSMYGASAWNKGLSKDTDERVGSISTKMKGRKHTIEAIEKMREAKLGKRGAEANNFKRGFTVNSSGYIEIHSGKQRMYLHRMIAEKYLGRKLTRAESVHHFDGDKANNVEENLVVISANVHAMLHRYCFPKSKEEQIDWLEKNGLAFELIKGI